MRAACRDCGLPYGGPGWIEAIIPDKVWRFISPTGNGNGILCINCMSRRLALSGLRRIPVWLCGTEPLTAREGDPARAIDVLRNWEPKLLKRLRRTNMNAVNTALAIVQLLNAAEPGIAELITLIRRKDGTIGVLAILDEADAQVDKNLKQIADYLKTLPPKQPTP